MTNNNSSILLIVLVAIGISFLVVSVPSALAHLSFDIKPGANANQTVRVTFGETGEPVFADEYGNLELTFTHRLTNLKIGGAGVAQNTAKTQMMFVDAYFYPSRTLVVPGTSTPSISGGVPAMTGCTGGAQEPFNCTPAAGFTDSRIKMNLSQISSNEGGVTGQYRQATRQLYTEQGRTLYHVYGELNYFNDTSIGPIPFNVWTDGSNVKKASWCEGLVANKAACISGTTTYNKTAQGVTLSTFGMNNMTGDYWPGSAAGVTENTHPSNIRKAIGSIRDNTFDIWNVLEDITDALRTVTGFGIVVDHVPRNSTNSGAPSSYAFP